MVLRDFCLSASSQYVWLDAQERSFPENPQHRNMQGILRQKSAFRQCGSDVAFRWTSLKSFSLQGYCNSDLLLRDDHLSHGETHENSYSYLVEVGLRDLYCLKHLSIVK